MATKTKVEKLELTIEQALLFFKRFEVDIQSLDLPYLKEGSTFHDDIYQNRHFQDLRVVPTCKDQEWVLKLTGTYVTQCKTGYQEGGMWVPAKPVYHPINITVDL